MVKLNEGLRQGSGGKSLKSGLDGFHDYEIIELLHTLGTPCTDCKQPTKDAMKFSGHLIFGFYC